MIKQEALLEIRSNSKEATTSLRGSLGGFNATNLEKMDPHSSKPFYEMDSRSAREELDKMQHQKNRKGQNWLLPKESAEAWNTLKIHENGVKCFVSAIIST